MSDLAAARRRYAQSIAGSEKILSPRLSQALAAVPREHFLDEGPWRVRSGTARNYRSTKNADPVHLYSDVLVAIDESRRLDTGLPSLWAHLLDMLDIKENERVVQIGCGLGYYSAILSRLVGKGGTIVAIDCEREFVKRARFNLRENRNVEVIHGNGFDAIPGTADVIVVHAGFSYPHPSWIKPLRRNGRLLVPLTRQSRQGRVVKISRLAIGYQAEVVRGIEIFPCSGRRDTPLDQRLTDWWEEASALSPLYFRRIDRGLPSQVSFGVPCTRNSATPAVPGRRKPRAR
jgi:protein-L-isoaspartate(D-aspartate) O-methyltransferase